MTAPPAAQPVILAVDDAPETLSLLTDIIEDAGMTALVARSGAAALTLIGRIQPDLILMDAVMPGMDGFETCSRIKARSATAHIPLIFMTGLSDTESVVKGFEAGGVDYVPKPIVASELVARIRVHLANARMTQSARIALDLAGPPVAAVDGEGEVLWVTPQGAEMLSRSFGVEAMSSQSWKEALRPDLAAAITSAASDMQLGAAPDGALWASYVGEGAPGEHLLRLRNADAPDSAQILQNSLGLTAREAEVLVWIARGKSNRDVAQILECSPRTVNKHLEQIYSKLNVDNRTAAAMAAMRRLTGAPG